MEFGNVPGVKPDLSEERAKAQAFFKEENYEAVVDFVDSLYGFEKSELATHDVNRYTKEKAAWCVEQLQ